MSVVEYSAIQQEGCFWECAECRAKPGSPALCESCLHNRTVIEHLKSKAAEPVQHSTHELIEFTEFTESSQSRAVCSCGWTSVPVPRYEQLITLWEIHQR